MAVKAKSKDKTLNMVYSLGAAVVILGALFKINHLSLFGIDGSIVLGAGLIVEAFIFVVFAFDPPKGEYEWENVYPQLLDESSAPVKKEVKIQPEKEIKEAEVSLSAKLDEMLSTAKLDVNVLEKLRKGIENFGAAVDGINKTVEAHAATDNYKDQLYIASSHLENLNALYQLQLDNGKKYVEASQKYVDDLSRSEEGAASFQKQLHLASSHLENLNSLYQLQLDNGKKYVEANQKYVDDLSKSEESTISFQQQLAELTANLNNLNKVYGGMLNAMKA
ncbi:MAG: gliding motility protein GldL [Flavobacteriaceae bacterium]|jgi:gliding motility-associated protein GldL|nr:gliding motility protein GldL [Flavobacteriaceae bacterium]